MKIIFLILFLFFPQISYSQSYDFTQPLIKDKKTNFDFNNKTRYKDPFFESSLPEFNFLDSQYNKTLINEKEKKHENALNDSISSRIRIAAHILQEPYTIQYLHSSGLGIAYNVISTDHIDEPESGGVGYSQKIVEMITPSYTFFFNNFSIGFGYSTKSGEKTKIWGCPSVCYDDVVELSTIELKQFLISYDIFENYELITGISFLSYEYGRYDYSDDNVLTNDDDYDVDSKEINNKLHINIGFGYKF